MAQKTRKTSVVRIESRLNFQIRCVVLRNIAPIPGPYTKRQNTRYSPHHDDPHPDEQESAQVSHSRYTWLGQPGAGSPVRLSGQLISLLLLTASHCITSSTDIPGDGMSERFTWFSTYSDCALSYLVSIADQLGDDGMARKSHKASRCACSRASVSASTCAVRSSSVLMTSKMSSAARRRRRRLVLVLVEDSMREFV